MDYQHRIQELRAVMSELSSAQTALVFCVERMNELLASDDWGDRIGQPGVPVADASQFSVRWRGRTCFMGNTKSFHLFVHLLRRVDEYVSPHSLLRSTWMGDSRELATIRSAIREMKAKLCTAKMKRLAGAVRCERASYGLMLTMARLR